MNINNMLHSVASTAKGPDLCLLIVLLIITAFLTGSLISEAFFRKKRRRSLADVSDIIKQIYSCKKEETEDLIKKSCFTTVQKKAFCRLIDTDGISDVMRTEAAQSLITEVENHYSKIINYTELVVKIAPMAGLMGTLIPLGPGIMALGHGDMQTLSESIITAFDTTVAGLISAGFATVISSIRKLWYKKYIADTESVMECLLEKMNTKEA